MGVVATQIRENFFLEKEELIFIHLYLCLYKQYEITDSEIRLLVELYLNGGKIRGKEEFDSYISRCIEKNIKTSTQSIRNSLSKMAKLGLLTHSRKHSQTLLLSNYLPDSMNTYLFLTYNLTNAKKS